jgi:hypothetical protein
MQLRYLGDSHDYIKFALLRHFHRVLNVKIGVNWYLTNPEDNRDGEQRRFLDNSQWACLDNSLYEKLRPFRDPLYRTFENFERDQVLPENTIYYSNNLSIQYNRTKWHEQALSKLSKAGLIFLDQDNGFEVESMTGRTQHKYALYKEAFDYYDSGKIVIEIQFANKVDPLVRAEKVREMLIQSKYCSTNLPVVRGRVTPNILFFTISPLSRLNEIEAALKLFAGNSLIYKKTEKRVNLIP